MNSFDARVRYTRMIIEKSFLELLLEKPVRKITVTELCKKAQINRATFYKHYLDIQDLFDKLEKELFDKIRNTFQEGKLKSKEFLVKMIKYTQDNQASFMALCGDCGDPELMTKVFLVCCESAYPLIKQNIPGINESERQLFYQFLSHGAGGVMTWWINNGMKEPAENVAQYIWDYCNATVECVQKKDYNTTEL